MKCCKTFLILGAVLLVSGLTSFAQNVFREDQLRYSRVRQAYSDSGDSMRRLLREAGLDQDSLRLYLRAFKNEKEIELWAKNLQDGKYQLLKKYRVCATSGSAGPKRKQGDLQIPEGFYHIDRFNPYSNFYLSLGINYPNSSDRILGERGRLGGDIFIHGACVTIGCLPIRDRYIKELYIFCIEARNAGQEKIPVNIFPARLEGATYTALTSAHQGERDKIKLWAALKEAYEIFNESARLPDITFLSDGTHRVEK